jgi:hypothetical protein
LIGFLIEGNDGWHEGELFLLLGWSSGCAPGCSSGWRAGWAAAAKEAGVAIGAIPSRRSHGTDNARTPLFGQGLSGRFTNSGTRKGSLFGFDCRRVSSFRRSPRPLQGFVDQVQVMGIKQVLSHRDLPGRGPMWNGLLIRFAASVWITSSSSESALSVVLSRRMFPITTAGALICRSAKTPRNSDEHRPAPKVRWSRFVKSVVYTTITNARPPKSITRQNRSNLWRT